MVLQYTILCYAHCRRLCPEAYAKRRSPCREAYAQRRMPSPSLHVHARCPNGRAYTFASHWKRRLLGNPRSLCSEAYATEADAQRRTPQRPMPRGRCPEASNGEPLPEETKRNAEPLPKETPRLTCALMHLFFQTLILIDRQKSIWL